MKHFVHDCSRNISWASVIGLQVLKNFIRHSHHDCAEPVFVTSSAKTRLMEKRTVTFWISLFHIFLFIDYFEIVQKARKSVYCRCSYETKSPGSDQT